MVIKLGDQTAIPWKAAIQMHRNNVPVENPNVYFKRSLKIHLLNNFIFVKLSKLCFFPSFYFKNGESRFLSTEWIKQRWLTNKEELDLEIKLWKPVCSSKPQHQCPDTLATPIKFPDVTSFLVSFNLSQTECIFPVTSCQYERRFLGMKRLRAWLTASMNMDCLGSLVILNIYRDIEIDYQEIAKVFFLTLPTKYKWKLFDFSLNNFVTYILTRNFKIFICQDNVMFF